LGNSSNEDPTTFNFVFGRGFIGFDHQQTGCKSWYKIKPALHF
jgi:hypothetical protein